MLWGSFGGWAWFFGGAVLNLSLLGAAVLALLLSAASNGMAGLLGKDYFRHGAVALRSVARLLTLVLALVVVGSWLALAVAFLG
jgi:hypothetical protein